MWRGIEALANRLGIWATALGVVWGGMSYLASYITALSGLGWAAYVFIGLGAACVLSLVMSAALVAWRYFNPLPPPPPLPVVVADATSIAPRKASLRAEDVSLRAEDAESARDILHLLDFGVYQTTLVMLSHLVDRIPEKYDVDPMSPFPAEFANAKARNDADIYLETVRHFICDGSERARNYQNIWLRAEGEADRLLRETPQDQRPPGVDSLILRDYAISFRRAVYTASFLRAQRAEIETIVIHQRSTMIERYRMRNA